MFGNEEFEGRSIGGGGMNNDLVSGRIIKKAKMCIFGWILGLKLRVASRSGELPPCG